MMGFIGVCLIIYGIGSLVGFIVGVWAATDNNDYQGRH